MAQTFRAEEQVGLLVALGLHGLLLAVLLLQPVRDEVFTMPERMTVSLASEVGLESTAPEPVAESRAAIAPTLSEEPQPIAEPEVQPEPQPRTQQPTARRTPVSRPTSTTPRRRPDSPQSRPTPRNTQRATTRSGGSRVGSDFLGGAGNSTRTDETRIPASQIGASAKASIGQAIARQVQPHWTSPSGLDSDKLVTIIAFRLNPDGSLQGSPRVVRQSGINESNRPQADLHKERAIRAVRRAAPFKLPPEYYNGWKKIDGARFDRNLSR